MSDRREELLEGAVDYALEHGIGTLTLRPLAQALGTSDRMLVYHFADKDQLVTAVLERAYERWFEELASRPRRARTPRGAVLDLWGALTDPVLAPCQRLYLEVAALSMFDPGRYREVNETMTGRWHREIVAWLVGGGADPRRATDMASVVGATLDGLYAELVTTGDERTAAAGVRRLADWAHAQTAPA